MIFCSSMHLNHTNQTQSIPGNLSYSRQHLPGVWWSPWCHWCESRHPVHQVAVPVQGISPVVTSVSLLMLYHIRKHNSINQIATILFIWLALHENLLPMVRTTQFGHQWNSMRSSTDSLQGFIPIWQWFTAGQHSFFHSSSHSPYQKKQQQTDKNNW